MHERARRLLPLLFVALAGCASRSQAPYGVAAAAVLPEGTAAQLVSAWQDEVCRYVDREGDGDPAVLAETKALRSPEALRPARITFGVLDVNAGAAARDGWDVQGVLVGRQASGAIDHYVFLVGIVARSGYVPVGIQDIRLVGLSVRGGRLELGDRHGGRHGGAALSRGVPRRRRDPVPGGHRQLQDDRHGGSRVGAGGPVRGRVVAAGAHGPAGQRRSAGVSGSVGTGRTRRRPVRQGNWILSARRGRAICVDKT